MPVLGTCAVCGKPCYGTHARPDDRRNDGQRGVIIRTDNHGVRHATCRPHGPGFGPGSVGPTDA